MKKISRATLLVMCLVAPSAFAQTAPKPAPAPAGGAAPAKPGAKPAGKPAAKPEPPPPPPPEPPPPPAGPPSLAESLSGDAKADYESGKVLFTDGDHAGALVKFKSAYEKSKDPRLLWNMAACEKNLRHYARSLALVRQYLKDGEAQLTEQDKAEGAELIKVMEPLTAKLKLNVTEPGAEVFVDDELVGTTPVEPVVVDIGTRKVRVKKAEFEEIAKDVPVGGAAEVALDLPLVRIRHEGRLAVHTATDASISLDGQLIGKGSWSGVVPSGGHMLRVTAPKMQPYQSEVYIQDKESRDLNVTLQAEPSKGLPAWAWIVGGAVVVGGLVTAGALVIGGAEDSYEGPNGNLNPGVAQASRRFGF